MSYTSPALGATVAAKNEIQVRLIQKRISKSKSGMKVGRVFFFIKVSQFYKQNNVFNHYPVTLNKYRKQKLD